MPQVNQPKSAFTAVLTAWLIAGTLDISSALVLYTMRTGKSPVWVLRYIASAAFGKTAYSGSPLMSIAGLLFHYAVAFIFTVLFFILYPKIHALIKNKFVSGMLYGLFVWIVMNLLVVPLTRIPPFSITFAKAAENIIILILAIGLPLALIVHNYYYGKTK
jgi:hypothetical protein